MSHADIRITRQPLADLHERHCWSVEHSRPIFGYRRVAEFYVDPDMPQQDVVEMAAHNWPFPAPGFRHPVPGPLPAPAKPAGPAYPGDFPPALV